MSGLNLIQRIFHILYGKFLQKNLNSQSNLEKEYKAREIKLPDFRLQCKEPVIKTVLYFDKSRNTDQWKWTERPEVNLTHRGHLVLKKEARIYNGEQSFFNERCWEDWTATGKRMKLEHFLTPYKK